MALPGVPDTLNRCGERRATEPGVGGDRPGLPYGKGKPTGDSLHHDLGGKSSGLELLIFSCLTSLFDGI